MNQHFALGRSAPQPADTSAAEQMLVEAVRRAGRQPNGRLALVLHLSRLSPPAPRPHHRRIARAILQDVAQRHEGQVFVPRNGDLVLLCRNGGSSTGERGGAAAPDRTGYATSCDPASLPDVLGRLLARDVPDPRQLVSIWPLSEALPSVTAYAQARLDETVAPVRAVYEQACAPGDVDAIGDLVATGGIQDMMQRQTAVALHAAPEQGPAGREPPGQALRPIYREVSFSIAALEARIRTGGQASSDPFLFRHLAGRMDRRMLEVLCQEVGTGRPLDIAAGMDATQATWPPLHINLTVPAVLSDSFVRLARACGAIGGALGIEISLIEACADAEAFARARAVVRAAGMTLVLDGVSHLALLLARPAQLDADLMKVEWSPRMVELRGAEMRDLDAALKLIGLHRVVLHRAETEAALRWGLEHGIRRFQGRHVDAMLGAGRIMGCEASARCALRQCIERASATGPGGRAGCANTALLDAASAARTVPPDNAGTARRTTAPAARSGMVVR